MDEFDRASQVEEKHRQSCIQAVLKHARQKSREECLDCDQPIPQKRRDVGGIVRCIKCQEIEEGK